MLKDFFVRAEVYLKNTIRTSLKKHLVFVPGRISVVAPSPCILIWVQLECCQTGSNGERGEKVRGTNVFLYTTWEASHHHLASIITGLLPQLDATTHFPNSGFVGFDKTVLSYNLKIGWKSTIKNSRLRSLDFFQQCLQLQTGRNCWSNETIVREIHS